MIATYVDLKSAIADWLDRTEDSSTVARIPEFIASFERRFSSEMRVAQMDAVATLTTTGSGYALPDDVAQLSTVSKASGEPLATVTPDFADRLAKNGTARYYYVRGRSIFTAPYDGQDIIVRYVAALTPLVLDSDTNWLLTRYPDAYKFGALAEAELYNRAFDAAQLWEAKYQAVASRIIEESTGLQWSGAQMRVMGPTP